MALTWGFSTIHLKGRVTAQEGRDGVWVVLCNVPVTPPVVLSYVADDVSVLQPPNRTALLWDVQYTPTDLPGINGESVLIPPCPRCPKDTLLGIKSPSGRIFAGRPLRGFVNPANLPARRHPAAADLSETLDHLTGGTVVERDAVADGHFGVTYFGALAEDTVTFPALVFRCNSYFHGGRMFRITVQLVVLGPDDEVIATHKVASPPLLITSRFRATSGVPLPVTRPRAVKDPFRAHIHVEAGEGNVLKHQRKPVPKWQKQARGDGDSYDEDGSPGPMSPQPPMQGLKRARDGTPGEEPANKRNRQQGQWGGSNNSPVMSPHSFQDPSRGSGLAMTITEASQQAGPMGYGFPPQPPPQHYHHNPYAATMQPPGMPRPGDYPQQPHPRHPPAGWGWADGPGAPGGGGGVPPGMMGQPMPPPNMYMGPQGMIGLTGLVPGPGGHPGMQGGGRPPPTAGYPQPGSADYQYAQTRQAEAEAEDDTVPLSAASLGSDGQINWLETEIFPPTETPGSVTVLDVHVPEGDRGETIVVMQCEMNQFHLCPTPAVQHSYIPTEPLDVRIVWHDEVNWVARSPVGRSSLCHATMVCRSCGVMKLVPRNSSSSVKINEFSIVVPPRAPRGGPGGAQQQQQHGGGNNNGGGAGRGSGGSNGSSGAEHHGATSTAPSDGSQSTPTTTTESLSAWSASTETTASGTGLASVAAVSSVVASLKSSATDNTPDVTATAALVAAAALAHSDTEATSVAGARTADGSAQPSWAAWDPQ